MRRVLFFLLLLSMFAPIAATAQSGDTIDIIRVERYLDDRAADWVAAELEELAGSSRLAIIQFDVAAVIGDGADLAETIANAPLPVATWVGPEGRTPTAEVRAIIEAAELVYGPAPLQSIDAAPAIRGLLIDAHDRSVTLADGSVATIDVVEPESDSSDLLLPAGQVVFHDQSLFDRFLRTALSPTFAMFFLVAGLAVAAFEFYAAGVGVAAAVSVVLLFLGGYGISVLPTRLWAVGLVVAGVLAFFVDFQRMAPTWRSLLGSVAFILGGIFFIESKSGLEVPWWGIALTMLSLIAWIVFAMTTVVRARFATPTIGREHVVGEKAVALTSFGPDGEVQLEGARWRATSARAAAIEPGDEVLVTRVVGVVLEVSPVEDD